MIAQRLVGLIEKQSDQLASGLVERLRHSSRTVGYLLIPEDELRRDAHDIYYHLGDWLMNKTESDIEYRFSQLGMRRAEQQVPICDFVWAIIITKENLWNFLRMHSGVDRVFELFGELELVQLIDQFFDRALYYSTVGYARCGRERPAKAA